VETLARLMGFALPRLFTLPIATLLAATPRLLRTLLTWAMPRLTQPAACCPEGGVHYRFVRRYLDLVERPGGLDYLLGYLQDQGPRRAGRLLESYWRMLTLGLFRHEVLARWRDRRGSPPTVLLEAQLAVYPGCNLACKGCYSEGDLAGDEPTRDHILHLVDEATRCGAWTVHVVGKGEPFLDEERARTLLEVIAARPHVMFSVATNGTFFTDEMGRRLARLGNVLLLVGVDGRRRTHDGRRGEGTHARVMETLERMRSHRLLYGFAAMPCRITADEVTDPAFVDQMARAGCVLGVYSRYFPLTHAGCDELLLAPAAEARYVEAFERAREASPLPLLDFDEVEAHTGCRARGGVSIYIDGISGQIAPCIRVPFAPPACRLDRDRGVGLPEVLTHPFFEAHRHTSGSRISCCGVDPAGELDTLTGELAAVGESDVRLAAYRARWTASDAAETELREAAP